MPPWIKYSKMLYHMFVYSKISSDSLIYITLSNFFFYLFRSLARNSKLSVLWPWPLTSDISRLSFLPYILCLVRFDLISILFMMRRQGHLVILQYMSKAKSIKSKWIRKYLHLKGRGICNDIDISLLYHSTSR